MRVCMHTLLCSLVCLIKLLLKWLRRLCTLHFIFEILLLKVIVVKVFAHILMVIYPGRNHVRILLVEVHTWRLTVEEHRLVVADLIRGQSGGPIEQHLTPKVGVLTWLVHRSIRLEVTLDVQLIFFKKGINFLIVRWTEHPIEITTHSVLLIMESVEVWATNCEHVLSQ